MFKVNAPEISSVKAPRRHSSCLNEKDSAGKIRRQVSNRGLASLPITTANTMNAFVIFIFLLLSSASGTIMYQTPIRNGRLGNRSVVTAYCAVNAPVDVNITKCERIWPMVLYEQESYAEFPLPLTRPIWFKNQTIAVKWISNFTYIPLFPPGTPPFWSGADRLGVSYKNCLNWRSDASCTPGSVGKDGISWAYPSCQSLMTVMCACLQRM